MKMQVHIPFSVLSKNQNKDTRTPVQFSSCDVDDA